MNNIGIQYSTLILGEKKFTLAGMESSTNGLPAVTVIVAENIDKQIGYVVFTVSLSTYATFQNEKITQSAVINFAIEEFKRRNLIARILPNGGKNFRLDELL